MKRYLIIAALLLAQLLSASFMGYAIFDAKIEKIYPGIKKQGAFYTKRIRIRLIRWLKSGGHRAIFGKSIAGKTKTVNLQFRKKAHANNISTGKIILVHYRTKSCFIRRSGKRNIYSKRTWTYIGKKK